jgi:hypothetical protein
MILERRINGNEIVSGAALASFNACDKLTVRASTGRDRQLSEAE